VSRDVKYNLTAVTFQIFTDEKIIIQIRFTLPLEAGGVLAKYCDDRDGMSVRSHIFKKMYVQTSRKFLCVLTVSVFGFSCENSAICCVHPVLWRTSRYGNYQFRGIPVRFHGAPATASAKLPLVGS